MSNIIDKIQLSGVTYDIGGQGGSGVSVVEVTQAEYDVLPSSAKTDTSKMYVITDAEAGDLTNYYTKTETNTLLGDKADTATTYTKTEVDNAITAATATKQDTLVSGTNIKTINNESILGSGNIDIQGGGGGKAVTGGTNISVTTGTTADTINCTLPITADTKHNYHFIHSYNTSGSENVTFGTNNNINANGSFIVGGGNYVYGNGSFIHGYSCIANKLRSHLVGDNLLSRNSNESSFGKYNSTTSASTTFGDSGNTLFSVGNGTADNARHNAFEIRQNGDIYITSGGTDIKLQDNLGGGGGGISSAECQTMINNSISGKADSDDVYTTGQTSGATELATAFAATQPKLSAGTGISIDANNVISATGGGGGGSYTPGDGIDITNNVISVTGKVDTTTYSAYTASTTAALFGLDNKMIDIEPKVNSAWTKGVRDLLWYPTSSGLTLEYNIMSGGTYQFAVQPMDESLRYGEDASGVNKYLGVYASGNTYSLLVNKYNNTVGGYRIDFPMSYEPSKVVLQLNSAYTGSTPSSNAIQAYYYDNNGVIYNPKWDYNSGTDSFTNSTEYTGITFAYDQITKIITLTLDSSYNYIRGVRTAKNFADENDLTNPSYYIGAVTIETNSYKLQEVLDSKQDTLIAGENITISGNVISATGGGGGGSITIDPSLDSGSTNPVANSAITQNFYDYAKFVGNAKYGYGVSVSFNEGTENYMGINLDKLKTTANGTSQTSTSSWCRISTINGKKAFSTKAANVSDFSLVETSAITTSISSSSTDAQVPSAKAVYDQLGGLKLVKLTQSAYDALSPNYDSNTLYVIVN